MKIVIIGNGIIALTTAFSLLQKDPSIVITIIGPSDKKGCASLAAAAMFNSFCELEPGILENYYETEKWLLNKSANTLWPEYLRLVESESNTKINHGFGTYLVNNHTSDFVEDLNFSAVVDGLTQYKEEFQYISPRDIPFYKPSAKGRAGKAIFIKNEGWVNPFHLIDSITKILESGGRVEFINQKCEKYIHDGKTVIKVLLENGETISGDIFFMATGASFTKIIEESKMGIDIPKIFFGVGYTLILRTDKRTLSNCIRTPNRGLACGTYAAPQEYDKTVIGASNNIMPWPEDNPRVTSVYALLKNAMEQINSDYYNAQLLKISLGWRPTSEDTLPLLGATSYPNFYIATGTKRDGLHCSPVISNFISDLILHGKSDEKFNLFAPERKPIRIYSRDEAINKFIKHTIDAHYQHDFSPSKDGLLISLEDHYRRVITDLHDKIGATDWGIPVELYNMYKYGHAQ